MRAKLLFTVLTVVCFFVLLELGLALIGIEPAYRSGDPLVGFSKQLPHFVETRDDMGSRLITTAPGKEALNPQSFPAEKVAGTFRIVSLGGSTTYGRPFWDETSFSGWLRSFLPAADSGRDWEVINAGGISYASYRILAVAEELAAYDPDLFILYLGHNEFLERRTYGDLLAQPKLLKDLRASASRLRTVTLIQRLTRSSAERENDKPIVLGGDVKRIPINAVGPEAYTRDDAFRDQVVNHFRLSLERLFDVAQQCGAKVLIVSPASNYRDVTPFKSEHGSGLDPAALDRWRVSHLEARAAFERGEPQSALDRLDECLAIDPRYAETHYRRGQALEALGRFADARAAYAQAIEEDICPLRAIHPTLAALRDIASAHDAPLVDFQALLESHCEHGIAGANYFRDHLHPTLEANRLLALEIIDRMAERNWASPDWNAADRERVTQRVKDGLAADRYATELCKLSYAMDAFGQDEMAASSLREALRLAPRNQEVIDYAVSFYTKKDQFGPLADVFLARLADAPEDRRALGALADTYNKLQRFAEAAATYERWLVLDPQNVTVLQQAGVARSQAGDHEQAIIHLQEAARLNPQSAHVQNNLALALATAGHHELALPHYERATVLIPSLSSAHYNWGLSLLALDRKEEAMEHFTRVRELQPGHPGATEHLQALRTAR